MRVIAGALRGKKLAKVPAPLIRPTSDRLRESIFNIIGNAVADAVVLDLFAGTGAMGIEALSRGAKWATFLDRSKIAIALIKRNLASCRFTDASRVVVWDITRNLNCLKAEASKFNMVFVDPPYNQNCLKPALNHLAQFDTLAPDAWIIVEHDPNETVPNNLPFKVTDQRTRSKTTVTFLRTVV